MKFDHKDQPGNDKSKDGIFIQIKDGDAINLVFRGEIYSFYSVFGVKGEASPDDEGARQRFRANAIVWAGDTFKAKILEFGKSIYGQMEEISKVCEITETKCRLSRKGSTKDNTEYTLLPVIKDPLTAVQLDAISRIPLNILDRGIKDDRI